MSSSADGMRSRVANFARASATIACQPRSFAPRHIASAVSTAPYTKRRGGGPYHSTKTFEPSSSVSSVLRPRRMSSSNCATASSSPSPTCSPDSSTSTFVPASSPSIAVKRIPRSSDSRSSASRWMRLISTRSRKTSISPPQGRPTLQARSSSIPYETSLGSPVASTSCAFSKTSLSTQPPETEPHIFPDSEIARLAPIGRGAERRVATTVATTTFSPSSFQRSISGRISFTLRASFRCRPALRRALRDCGDYGRAGTGQRTEGPRAFRRRAAGTRDCPSAG